MTAGWPGPATEWHRTVSLRTRLTLAFAVGTLLLFASLASLTYEFSRSYLLRQRKTSALRQTYVNARLVKITLGSVDADTPGCGVDGAPGSVDPRAPSGPDVVRSATWPAQWLAAQ